MEILLANTEVANTQKLTLALKIKFKEIDKWAKKKIK
jgi:hypothetical protein